MSLTRQFKEANQNILIKFRSNYLTDEEITLVGFDNLFLYHTRGMLRHGSAYGFKIKDETFAIDSLNDFTNIMKIFS